jgi:ferredoxin-type protein NapH
MFKNLTISGKRFYAQILATVVTNSFFLAPYLKYVPCPSLNCYACPLAIFACPIGTLQHFLIIGIFPFLLLGVLFLVGALIGRWACGYLCPFGWIQDLLARIRRKKLPVPDWLGWGTYVSLFGLVILLPILTNQAWFQAWFAKFFPNALVMGEPWFCKLLCPAGALEGGIPIGGMAIIKTKMLGKYDPIYGMISSFFYFKLALLFAILVASIYIKRPFCRFLCPLGLIFGFFNRFSLMQIKVDKSKVGPKADYRKLCPVDIDICDDPVSAKCIRCLQCTKCPGVTRK